MIKRFYYNYYTSIYIELIYEDTSFFIKKIYQLVSKLMLLLLISTCLIVNILNLPIFDTYDLSYHINHRYMLLAHFYKREDSVSIYEN